MDPDQLIPTTSYPIVVGTVLADLRKAKGLKQSELADRIGVNQSAWSKVERGATPLTIEHLANVAEEFEMTPSEILGRADRLTDYAKERGLHVENNRLTGKNVLAASVVIIGAAALGALIAQAFSED